MTFEMERKARKGEWIMGMDEGKGVRPVCFVCGLRRPLAAAQVLVFLRCQSFICLVSS
jgi:hypothetical protein